MAGIYIHIPFCVRRCRYCDFYSTTSLERREAYVLQLKQQIRERRDEIQAVWSHPTPRTIYLGGGTPSTLSPEQIARVLEQIKVIGGSEAMAHEVTMEANPGDLTIDKLMQLRQAGVNRLSIGIQSFQDELLERIGRRHTAQEALEVVVMAQQAGFDNISVDLMYGLPGQTMTMWQEDVKKLCQLHIRHVSAYCLTYEEGTPLYRALEKGEVEELPDELLNQMQECLQAELEKIGIMRYEVSNYALPGYESKHNSSYWTHAPYVGIGAGAHGFDGKRTRYATDASLARNMEELTDDDLYNETIMLGLRTTRGVSLTDIGTTYRDHFLKTAEPYLNRSLLRNEDAMRFVATREGFRILNRIIEDLMI